MKILNSKPIYDIFTSKKTIKKENDPLKNSQKVFIDYREKNSLVAMELLKLGLEIEFLELKVGDYIIKDTVIERKTISDFLNSMINKHLLKQIEELKQYENRILIIEGFDEKQLYGDQNTSGINPSSIRGFILSILLKHKTPIIYTQNSSDTAKFILTLSKKQSSEISLKAKKRNLGRKEQLEFIIEGFPNIGPKKARLLLDKFGSIQNIILAPTEELETILGKNAEFIREIIERKYV